MLEKRGQPNDTTCVIHSFVTSSNNLSEREAARFYTPTINALEEASGNDVTPIRRQHTNL
ncbi:hypothetical protein H0G86_005344 [Trichoderma simmonsii]|uniref:Uncharacterized protein n=1 Tax=Trichoderma simmonsii TaxID=1491479 RepID=A0A8G0PIU5_9HYPO|nr:hypothetical protein H0G86_005344 [Trichoderma simmonsii]